MNKPDLSKPSLAGLSYLLRHMQMVEDFQFNYNKEYIPKYDRTCKTVGCAIGLAWHWWPELRNEQYDPYFYGTYDELGMPVTEGKRIFYNGETYGVDDDEFKWEGIRPEQVADEIDKYLENRK